MSNIKLWLKVHETGAGRKPPRRKTGEMDDVAAENSATSAVGAGLPAIGRDLSRASPLLRRGSQLTHWVRGQIAFHASIHVAYMQMSHC